MGRCEHVNRLDLKSLGSWPTLYAQKRPRHCMKGKPPTPIRIEVYLYILQQRKLDWQPNSIRQNSVTHKVHSCIQSFHLEARKASRFHLDQWDGESRKWIKKMPRNILLQKPRVQECEQHHHAPPLLAWRGSQRRPKSEPWQKLTP